MRVERFSLFFPPTLFRVRRGETEYAIGAIPAGGYVKITGMNPEEIGDLDPEVARRAYYSQAPWKRIVVILAGPGVNILIAFLLFWAVLFSGNLNGAIALGNLDPSVQTVLATTSVPENRAGAAGRWGAAAGGSDPRGGRSAGHGRIGEAGDRRPPLCRRSTRRLPGSDAGAVDGPSCRTRRHAVGLPPLQQGRRADAGRLRIRRHRQVIRRAGRRRRRRERDVARHDPDADRLRPGPHELQGSRAKSRASSASPRTRTKRSSPAPATRWCSSASSPSSSRSSTCSRSCPSTAGTSSGRWPRRCADGGSRCWPCTASARWESCCCCSSWSTASATTSAVWAADRRAGPRVRRVNANPALDERADPLGARRPEQLLHLRAGAADRSPPTPRRRPGASRVFAAAPATSGPPATANAARAGTTTPGSARTIPARRGGSPRRTPRGAPAGRARSRSSSTRGRTLRRRTAARPPRRRRRTVPGSRGARSGRRR